MSLLKLLQLIEGILALLPEILSVFTTPVVPDPDPIPPPFHPLPTPTSLAAVHYPVNTDVKAIVEKIHGHLAETQSALNKIK